MKKFDQLYNEIRKGARIVTEQYDNGSMPQEGYTFRDPKELVGFLEGESGMSHAEAMNCVYGTIGVAVDSAKFFRNADGPVCYRAQRDEQFSMEQQLDPANSKIVAVFSDGLRFVFPAAGRPRWEQG